ncbi:hypothetical protein D3C76_1508140 [compost metagenome]
MGEDHVTPVGNNGFTLRIQNGQLHIAEGQALQLPADNKLFLRNDRYFGRKQLRNRVPRSFCPWITIAGRSGMGHGFPSGRHHNRLCANLFAICQLNALRTFGTE